MLFVLAIIYIRNAFIVSQNQRISLYLIQILFIPSRGVGGWLLT